MASGPLGVVSPAVNTETLLYLCPATYKATGTVNICNTSSSGAIVRVGISPTNIALVTANYLMYDVYIPADGQPYQVTGLVLTAGNGVRVKSDTANIAFVFMGVEAAL